MQVAHCIGQSQWSLTGSRRYRSSERMAGYRRREGIVLLQVRERCELRFTDGSVRAEFQWRDANPDDLLQTIKPE